MNRAQVELLLSITRMHMRKKEREFEKLERKPGQSMIDFERFQRMQADRINAIRQTFVDLRNYGETL